MGKEIKSVNCRGHRDDDACFLEYANVDLPDYSTYTGNGVISQVY